MSTGNDPGRDHGGGLDAAMARYGGNRSTWVDLSTGINPQPYDVPQIPTQAWTTLPDSAAMAQLITAARTFWQVPDGADILATHGASAPIARIPSLAPKGRVAIAAPSYNEHEAAFRAFGWTVGGEHPDAMVAVHPNNPDGRMWQAGELTAPLTIIDESFCDIAPGQSHMARATRPGTLILKSFGKFWGLAGLRLGFVIGDPALIARLREGLGPWSVSGPALSIGAIALADNAWADTTRARLMRDAVRLDRLVLARGATLAGGTSLFRLYEVNDAAAWQDRLARGHVWSRIFPYSGRLIRLGLPGGCDWNQVEATL